MGKETKVTDDVTVINKKDGDSVILSPESVTFQYGTGDSIRVSTNKNGSIVMEVRGCKNTGNGSMWVVFLKDEAKLVKELIDRNLA